MQFESYDANGRYIPPPGPPAYMRRLQEERQSMELLEITQREARDAEVKRRTERQLAELMRRQLARD